MEILLTLGPTLRVYFLIKLSRETSDYNVVLVRENIIHRPYLMVVPLN